MMNCDMFAYDEVQRCYYCILKMNKDSINFCSDNGLDLVDSNRDIIFNYAAEFIKKHWSEEEWKDFKIAHFVVDVQREEYDEADKVNRRLWKYVFRIMRKDGGFVDGDNALKRIDAPTVDSNSSFKDVSEVLKYYVSSYDISEDDVVLMIAPSISGMLYIKSEEKLAEDVEKILKDNEAPTVKEVIAELESNGETVKDVEFMENVLGFVENNKESLMGKITKIGFNPLSIFDEK